MSTSRAPFSRREILKTAAAAAPALVLGRGAFAQAEYPSRPITVVAVFAPGTGADALVRYFARKLQEATGKIFVVENKVGQGGNIGAEYVAKSRADGYTITFAPSTTIFSQALALYKNLPYDPIKDFEHIHGMLKGVFVMVVPASAPYKTLAELTEYLKKKGDKAAYGFSSHTARIASELYNAQYGLKAIHVGYKSAVEAVRDLEAGQFDFFFTDPGTIRAQINPGGKLRALVTASRDGIKALPFIPSAASQGLDMDLIGYFGVHAPKNTPKSVQEWLAKHIGDLIRKPETVEFLERFGFDPWDVDGETVKQTIIRENEPWIKYTQLAGIEPQ